MVMVNLCTLNSGLTYHVKPCPKYLDSRAQKLHIWKIVVADRSLPAGNEWSWLVIVAGQGRHMYKTTLNGAF